MHMEIGAQLYTVREFCKTLEDFEETLKKIADIGYVIGPRFRGQGYAKEAVALLIQRLNGDGIHRIFGACHPDNTASHAVMRACGRIKTTEIPGRVSAREEESGLQGYLIETQH